VNFLFEVFWFVLSMFHFFVSGDQTQAMLCLIMSTLFMVLRRQQ